jgi:cobalt transporter subunit CbtA
MADFRRLTGAALLAGLAAGLWLCAARQVWVVPLILQAEAFELAPSEHAAHHGHGTPPDGRQARMLEAQAQEWEPADGWERAGWTWAANLLTSFGFALLLVGGYGLRGGEVGWRRGLLWGLAGFMVFSAAPALGLPPALPGVPEAPLLPRQLWWMGTVLATGGGLVLLAFARGNRWRWLAIPLLLLPHVVGAPRVAGTLPHGLAVLTRQFLIATLLVNLSSWLVLGAVSGWLWSRFSWLRSA